ncbi:PHD-finger domain-containing protein [Hirsutella rhossiliensis]|uniref:PHD-finger domain-containing protein n=1 Tax=Hirsutella rhossiliensis TaxID=111463 RepID=A0A9P8N728_9HYPO|nr:PHD-finger domain-containing protein [Hirsutella rhossiliensis]KAH0967166.1 PHD-finger domain-containing protein [Hirsutella rhossiliensis]
MDMSPSTVEVSSAPTAPNTEGSDALRDAASSQASPAYKPQFSASSSWILERLRNSEDAPDSSNVPSLPVSAVKGEPDNLAMQSTQPMASTLAMPEPRAQQPLAGVSDIAKRLIHFRPPSLKRKRSSDDLEADFTQNTVPFRVPAPARLPELTTSSLHLKEASELGSARHCSKCGQSSLPSEDNAFIACIGCQSWSHLQCASATTDMADNANYLCLDCKMGPGKEKQTGAEYAEAHERQLLVNRIRNKRLSKLPAGVVPAKPELVGFLAKQASDSERTEYFYSKKRRDLLNILSLCDQLKPQLLVDILVSVSKKHPDLPIFDDPDWRANLPSRAAHPKSKSTSQSVRVFSQPRHGLALLHAKESRKPRGRPRLMKQNAVAEAEVVSAEIAVGSAGDGGENSLPPTWPQAGQGLYAKLPPEDEDRDFLVDDNDEEAFSHFMVDKMGKQMVVSVCA